MPEFTLPYTYTVHDGVVDTSNVMTNGIKVNTKPELLPKFHTIPEAFNVIQNAINDKIKNIDVAYNETL